ncbi:hypothetical protein ACFOFO_21420 [Undibacterium arcticum]|uniref:Uncharacterized protein n=2 Tax=Undibacterium arcticum TaxID=1762892 RepID=A0ABV7F9U4_9BURK
MGASANLTGQKILASSEYWFACRINFGMQTAQLPQMDSEDEIPMNATQWQVIGRS